MNIRTVALQCFSVSFHFIFVIVNMNFYFQFFHYLSLPLMNRFWARFAGESSLKNGKQVNGMHLRWNWKQSREWKRKRIFIEFSYFLSGKICIKIHYYNTKSTELIKFIDTYCLTNINALLFVMLNENTFLRVYLKFINICLLFKLHKSRLFIVHRFMVCVMMIEFTV